MVDKQGDTEKRNTVQNVCEQKQGGGGEGEDEVLYEAPTYGRLQRVLDRAGRRTFLPVWNYRLCKVK